MKKILLTHMKWLMLFSLLTSSLYAAADSMNSITGPTTITKGEDITLTVDFLASEERTVAVYFQSLNQKVMHFYKRYTVNADDTTLAVTFAVPDNIPTDGTFRYKAYIAPKGGYWSNNLGNATQNGVTYNNDAIVNDTVRSIKGPETITIGEEVTLTVDYVASEDRTLVVYLKATTDTKKNYFYKRITVHAGDELEQVTFTVPANAPTDATYKYGTYIAPLGKYYKDHLGKASQYGVKVNNADTNPPLTREELIQLVTTWEENKTQENADAITNANVSQITNMSEMFRESWYNYPRYNTDIYPDLSKWDVSHVTDMSMMFSGNTYERPYAVLFGDITNWDVSNVTDMQSMFSHTSFNQHIGNWDVSNVTNMQYMFHLGSFNQDISGWDVENVARIVHQANIDSFAGSLESKYWPSFKHSPTYEWYNIDSDKPYDIEENRYASAIFSATPAGNNVDTVIGLSNGKASAYTDLAVIVRFASNGMIDTRDGNRYVSHNQIEYSRYSEYSFDIKIDFLTHTYSVWVSSYDDDLDKVLLAENVKFRTEQSNVSSLNNIAIYSNKGGLDNFWRNSDYIIY